MTLDRLLEARLRLLEASGQIDADIAVFVRAAALDLAAAAGRPATDELFGTLCTHTGLALQRSRRGEAVSAWDVDHAAELAAHPDAVRAAKALLDRAAGELAVQLPPAEEQFVALHLAALERKDA
ncbi:MAG TPA: hypothetical protein VF250_16780 [Conexibacter sp.]